MGKYCAFGIQCLLPACPAEELHKNVMLHFLRLGNGGVVLLWGLVFAKKEHFLKYFGGGYFIWRNNVSSAVAQQMKVVTLEKRKEF